MPITDDDPPELTSKIVANDDQLWTAINDVILASPGYRKRRRRIIRQQKKLQAMVSDEAWQQQYLKVDAMVNANNEAVVTGLVKWAWGEGVKFGGRR